MLGDASNVAARVQIVGGPGSVLVTIDVLRQIPGLFVAEECIVRDLVGLSAPVNLFRIVRASGGRRGPPLGDDAVCGSRAGIAPNGASVGARAGTRRSACVDCR